LELLPECFETRVLVFRATSRRALTHDFSNGGLIQDIAVTIPAEVAREARGVQHLSLRELSRELGVSHASPQRHFATKQDLIDALALMGFHGKGVSMGQSRIALS
jgi:Bacterial regulatory proteins, tetR family